MDLTRKRIREIVIEELKNISEKAKSKSQQRFMGMVRATQKGEKPTSAKVAKVAKSMKKKDVEDFASTKHKGLPEKKRKDEITRLKELIMREILKIKRG